MLQVTPENVFVLYSFESILSGLLALVLTWVLFRNRENGWTGPSTTLLGALCSLAFAFFLCSTLHFYEFYFQERFLDRDPEAVACGFFFTAVILLGGGFNLRSPSQNLPTYFFLAGAAVGLLHLLGHLAGLEQGPLAYHFLVISGVFAVFIFAALLRPRGERKTRVAHFLVLFGLSVSFLSAFLKSYDGLNSTFWISQHLAVLLALLAIAYVVESNSGDLFVKFFIRLNLTFILLAGIIILLVAGVERRQYVAFAAREAEDLMEFLQDHVMYFYERDQDDRQVLGNSEISKRIVSGFGNVSELQSVSIRLNRLELRMSIDPEGLIERVVEEQPDPTTTRAFDPLIDGNTLRLSAPIYSRDELAGWVELSRSLVSMNKAIAHQIMIIFSAFTVVVLMSGIVTGIIVNQADNTIQQQYRELEETHRQLFQAAKLAALGEMAGGVAHEINNPLGVILGRADYLANLARQKNGAEFSEDLEVIQNNATRAGRIISDLLDFARSHPLNRQRRDLNALVTKTAELMKPRAESVGVTLEKKLSRLPPVEIDRDRVQQVLVNLINNSIDACKGEGRVLLQTRLNSAKSQVEISVEDDGVGIPSEHQKNIFDPFFTTKERGTGLGLSVSYSIVHDHGGQILVKSEPGLGASFTVTFPVARREALS